MKSRLLGTTAALSVALAAFQPMPLVAQDAGADCIPADGVDCPPAAQNEPQAIEDEAPPPVEEPAEAPPPEPEPDSGDAAPEPDVIPPDASEPTMDEMPAPPADAEIAPEAPADGADLPAEDSAPADESLAPDAGATVAEPQEAPTDPATEPPSAEADGADAGPTEGAPLPDAEQAPAADEPVAEDDAADTQPDADALRQMLEDKAAADALADAAGDGVAPKAESPAPDDAGQEPAEGAGAQTAGDEAKASLLDALGDDAEDGAEPPAAAAEGEPAGAMAATRITEDNSRSSSEDFSSHAKTGAQRQRTDDDDGLSNFQKFGLLALGALAVGSVLNNGDQVVSNTGDRVVVQRQDGRYMVLKDDDTLLRRPGSEVRTRTFSDGSTRSVVLRQDGSRIVTIRDASGRVLRRSAVDPSGREVLLIDDLASFDRVDVSRLPEPAPVIRFTEARDDRALREALEQARSRDPGRSYSLRQIRDYREVRALAPAIDVDQITFETGSAAVRPQEAEKLAALGRAITRMIDERPNELFLIEGHTDAVGSDASNLALSDRRAESVALALTEYFRVPPENMVVQGYGESDLRVRTDAAEQLNRRVAVRLISPLLQTAAR